MKRSEGKKKKKIGKRLRLFTTIVILTLTIILIGSSTVLNVIFLKNFYNDKTMQIAKEAADMVDPEYISELYAAISTEEYRQIFQRAEEQNDFSEVEQWMDEKGFRTEFEQEIAKLKQLGENMSAKYIYVQIVEGDKCFTILDPYEEYISVGCVDELTGSAYEDIHGNQQVTPIVAKTEYGWLSTGGQPIYNTSGDPIAIAFCDVDVTDMVNNIGRTVYINAAISLLMACCISLYMGRHIKREITSPIEKLTDAADDFRNDEAGFSKDKVAFLDINTGDEIEELYHAIHFMQESIIEYMDNLTTITAEKERISAELDVATRIQASMLPTVYPAFPDQKEFDIYASMKPAKEVGGDFYDYFLIDDDHLGIVIADVSGKGVPAALFMMMSKIVISNFAHMGLSPSEVLKKTNDYICKSNEEEMFVTVWFGIMEISTGHIVAGNAGHEYPMIRRKDGDFEIMEDKHDFVLGGIAEMSYTEYAFDLEKGDTLFIYTDGCPEATNEQNELFGTDRMLEALNRNADADPIEILENMTSAVNDFVKSSPQFDDLTMLALKFV